MPDIVISQPAVTATPAVTTIAGAQDFELLSVQATFDGSGAGSAFFPTLELLSPAGQVMVRVPATSVAAAGSAEVSWFPSMNESASPGGSGIKFDTENLGDYLDIEATGFSPVSGKSVYIQGDHSTTIEGTFAATLDSTSGSAIVSAGAAGSGANTPSSFEVDSDGSTLVRVFKASKQLLLSSSRGTILIISGASGGTGGITIQDNAASTAGIGIESGSGNITLDAANVVVGQGGQSVKLATSGVGAKVGFFGVGPVVKQATPVTLADVIALLQAYGLSA